MKEIRDAVSQEIRRWMDRNGFGGVPIKAGWSLVHEINSKGIKTGRTCVLVTQGPMGASLLNRGEVERDIGLQISVVQLLPQQDAPTDSNLDEVVDLRIKLEDWMLVAAHSCDAISRPHGDYSFVEFLRAANTEQALVEELLKSNVAASYFIASWATG